MDMTQHEQVKATITTLVTGASKLKKLNITCDSLATMDPGLLASGFSVLDNFHLSCKELTDEQTKKIFTAITVEDSKLVLLNLSGQIPLASVEPQLLSRAFNRLYNLHLSCQPMTKQQMEEIFSAISSGDSKLKILVISSKIPLASVEPGLLARAAKKMESLHMYSARLTTEQGEAILEQSF